MANEFIIRKGYIALEDSQITGSLSVTNAVTASFFTGSYRGDGSQLTGIEGFPFTGSAGITGSLTVVGPVNATTFTGDGSQLTGIEGFPFTGSAKITGSLEVTGSVTATSFTGSLQGIATSASYVQLANVDGFTAYSASVNTAIDSVLDATTPLTATVNTTNSPFTVTSQSIVIIDSTNGDVTVNLPDLNAINGTPDQKPILLYKNDYSQNVIYVEPSGSQLVNGTTQDIIVSIQIAIAYNPTSAGWVTEGTSYQSLAELELFFVPRTETGSFATTGSNQFSGSQTITGSLTVTGNITGNITGSASTASYVEYTNVANKPALVSGSSQITYSGLTGIPSGIISGSAQIASFGIFATTGSNQFNGNQSITGSLTVSGQVVAQTLNVQQVTSSIVYSSGSNVFGNSLSNTQQFTGSVSITGSLTVNGTSAVVGSGTVNYLPKFTAGSTIGNSVIQESSGNIGIGVTPTRILQLSSSGSNAAIRLDNTVSGRPFLLTYDDSQNLTFINSSDSGHTAFNSGTGASTTKMLLTNAGNLGLGVTPSAWSTAGKNIEFGNGPASIGTQNSGDANFMHNAYESPAGTFKYAGSGIGSLRYQLDINNNIHKWYNAPSGTAGNAITFTQAMTLDASGRLGIGTTSPSTFLHVFGANTSNRGQLSIQSNNASNAAKATWYYDTTLQGEIGTTSGDFYALAVNNFLFYAGGSERMRISSGGNVLIGTTTDAGSKLQVAGNLISATLLVRNESNSQTIVGIGNRSWWTGGASDNDAAIGTYSPNMCFFTNNSGTERMRITSGGNVGIGVTPSYQLHIQLPSGVNDQIIRMARSAGAYAWGIGIDGANSNFNFYNNGSTSVANINNSTGAYTATSDERLKENIEYSESAIDKLLNIKVRKYDWKDSEIKEDYGFVAQELFEVLPQYVLEGNEESNWGIAKAELVPFLVKAIQEQQAQIEILKAEIQTLKQ